MQAQGLDARGRTVATLADTLIAHASPTGGWGYYAGKASRLEPTCWALRALGPARAGSPAIHRNFFQQCQRPDGFLADAPGMPPNYSSNGQALLTMLDVDAVSPAESTRALAKALAVVEGTRSGPLDVIRQDNMLQGWSWMEGMFSWVEPTSWCVLAFKRYLKTQDEAIFKNRITQGEKLLEDRCCEAGGWNFGNSNVLGAKLPAYVPTTAVALMALHDRRDLPFVGRSLDFLERRATSEPSGMALSLALMTLRLYQRPEPEIEHVETTLLDQWQRTGFVGNLCTMAMALCALEADRGAAAGLSVS